MEQEFYGIIYKATNLVNGKCYIGQTTKTLHRRIKVHYKCINELNNTSFFILKLKKYTPAAFSWEVLCQCESKDELNEMEFHYIMQYKSCIYIKNSNGYNLTFGGPGISGHKHSKETKECMSIKAIDRNLNIEYINKVKKTKSTKEYKEKMHKIFNSEDFKDKQRKHTKSLWENEEFKRTQIEKIHNATKTDEYKEKQTENTRKLWKNVDYINKIKNTKNSLEHKLKVCKTYIITSIIGDVIIVNTGLKNWCKENNICMGMLFKCINKNISYKGYFIKKLDD